VTAPALNARVRLRRVALTGPDVRERCATGRRARPVRRPPRFSTAVSPTVLDRSREVTNHGVQTTGEDGGRTVWMTVAASASNGRARVATMSGRAARVLLDGLDERRVYGG
jgi:hypothetical protein